ARVLADRGGDGAAHRVGDDRERELPHEDRARPPRRALGGELGRDAREVARAARHHGRRPLVHARVRARALDRRRGEPHARVGAEPVHAGVRPGDAVHDRDHAGAPLVRRPGGAPVGLAGGGVAPRARLRERGGARAAEPLRAVARHDRLGEPAHRPPRHGARRDRGVRRDRARGGGEHRRGGAGHRRGADRHGRRAGGGDPRRVRLQRAREQGEPARRRGRGVRLGAHRADGARGADL
ncbi:MAG: Tol-Pal system protein TolQ, partial [uncultured Gemmatimonadaceae bacterium]